MTKVPIQKRGPKPRIKYDEIQFSKVVMIEGRKMIVGTPFITKSLATVQAARQFAYRNGFKFSVITSIDDDEGIYSMYKLEKKRKARNVRQEKKLD